MTTLTARLRLAADLHLRFGAEDYDGVLAVIDADPDPGDLVLALLALGQQVSLFIEPEVYRGFLTQVAGAGDAAHALHLGAGSTIQPRGRGMTDHTCWTCSGAITKGQGETPVPGVRSPVRYRHAEEEDCRKALAWPSGPGFTGVAGSRAAQARAQAHAREEGVSWRALAGRPSSDE